MGAQHVGAFGSAANFLVCSAVAQFLREAGIVNDLQLQTKEHSVFVVPQATTRGQAAAAMDGSQQKRGKRLRS